MIIKPTVGRVVWFRGDQEIPNSPDRQPFVGIVTYVHSDIMVNLAVFDHYGNLFPRTSVYLVQPGAPVPSGFYCEWPAKVAQEVMQAVGVPAAQGASGPPGGDPFLIPISQTMEPSAELLTQTVEEVREMASAGAPLIGMPAQAGPLPGDPPMDGGQVGFGDQASAVVKRSRK